MEHEEGRDCGRLTLKGTCAGRGEDIVCPQAYGVEFHKVRIEAIVKYNFICGNLFGYHSRAIDQQETVVKKMEGEDTKGREHMCRRCRMRRKS